MWRRRARILHGPWNIAGNPLGLSRGERELGFRSDVAVLEGHPFGYQADLDLNVSDRNDRAARRKKALFLGRAILHYDVFHYSLGQTFFHTLDEEGRLHSEIPLLKRLGKTILATFQGDDARPRSHNPFAPQDDASLTTERQFQAQRRDLMLDYADRVFFVNPDLRQWLPGGEFRPYASVNPRLIAPAPPPQPRDEVVVAHGPSDRKQKGTDTVVAAVEGLRQEGLPIRLDLIENLPHEEVLPRLAAADLAVDQLNIGWYGAFAVEMMAVGRPVLAYVREDAPEDNPFGAELPIIRTNPETLRDDLRAIVEDRDRRVELGRRSREFAERRHDPREIARQNLAGLVEIPAGDPDS